MQQTALSTSTKFVNENVGIGLDTFIDGLRSPSAVHIDGSNEVSFSILSNGFKPNSVRLGVGRRSTARNRVLVRLVGTEIGQVVTGLTGTGVEISTEILVVPFVAR